MAESCSVFGMGIQLLEDSEFTVTTPYQIVCKLCTSWMAFELGAQQSVLERPLPVYVVHLQYITKPQIGPQNISLGLAFTLSTHTQHPSMKISQLSLHLHFKVALYSHGEDIKSHLPSNK